MEYNKLIYQKNLTFKLNKRNLFGIYYINKFIQKYLILISKDMKLKLDLNIFKMSKLFLLTKKNDNLVKMNKLLFFCSFKKNLISILSIFKNNIFGIQKGFLKEIVLKGTGYRCWLKEDALFFALGFSHLFKVKIPKDIIIICKKTELLLYSKNKIKLSNFIALLLKLKKPDAYKGKGLILTGTLIKLKAGKQRQRS